MPDPEVEVEDEQGLRLRGISLESPSLCAHVSVAATSD